MANEYSDSYGMVGLFKYFFMNVEFLKIAENKAKQNGIAQEIESGFLKVV